MGKGIRNSKRGSNLQSSNDGSVSSVRNGSEPPDIVAVLCSDLHLSHRPPSARTDNWYDAMDNYLGQLCDLCKDLPCIIAGDLFDRWNSPAELINFVMHRLPGNTFAIPGQHDLPFHSYKDIKKSAYWTLVESGAITNISPDSPIEWGPNYSRAYANGSLPPAHPIRLHGFPFGYSPKLLEKPHDLIIEIAVVHSYIWIDGCGYEGAPYEQHCRSLKDTSLNGYDVAVFGDNHIHFQRGKIFNCGGFMRRNIDQRTHMPSVGLLDKDGKVHLHVLDTSVDRFIDVTENAPAAKNHSAFIEEMSKVVAYGFSFRKYLERLLDKNPLDGKTRSIILTALENEDI